jgi:O-antigen ligase
MVIFTFLVLNGLVISGLIFKFGILSIFLCLAVAVIAFFYNEPVKILLVLVFIFPFSGTELLSGKLIPIPGFKPLQLFALLSMAIALMNIHKSVEMPPLVILFFGTVIVVFAFSIAHAYFYLDQINAFIADPLTPGRFFLSKFCKPLIFILPALIMTKFIYRRMDLDKIAVAIDWSIMILSVYILFLYLRHGGVSLTSREIREFLWASLGTHTNNLANYYIMGFPFVLARFFQSKTPLSYLKIALAAVGLALLFSRSAYCLFILSIFLYTFISKRIKTVPLVAGLLVAAALFVVPETVIQRATKGFETQDSNEILAGRIEGLWRPLIEEYAENPKAVIFGRGRYAIVSTKAHQTGSTLQAQHPHNMYLEAVMDMGIIGLVVFLSLFGFLLSRSFAKLAALTDKHVKENLVAAITSLICFLASGLTDRTFFPDDINGYLWIIVAQAFILMRYADYGESIPNTSI